MHCKSQKNPTVVEKGQYTNLLVQLWEMFRHNEMEDEEKFKTLWDRLRKSDITQIKEIRKQNRKKTV